MIRTYKYLLRPNNEQFKRLDYLLLQHRLMYNTALEQRIKVYKETGKGVKYTEQSKYFLDLRRSNPETLGQVNTSSLQHTLRRLDKAFSAFFRRLKEGKKAVIPLSKNESGY